MFWQGVVAGPVHSAVKLRRHVGNHLEAGSWPSSEESVRRYVACAFPAHAAYFIFRRCCAQRVGSDKPAQMAGPRHARM